MPEVSLIIAFVAGVVSFLSPCVLPLVPGYLSFVSGMSFDELTSAEGNPGLVKRAAVYALAFIAGFSTIFVALGASATMIGQVLLSHMTLFNHIAGVLVIVLGLHIMGVFKIGILYREKRFTQTNPKAGLLTSYLTGLAFAFAWTPCIGPILGAILAMAGTQDTVDQGILLLSIYSVGLGVPFLLAALMMQSFLALFRKIKGSLRTIEVGAGLLVITMGLLMVTNNVAQLAGYFTVLNRFVW